MSEISSVVMVSGLGSEDLGSFSAGDCTSFHLFPVFIVSRFQLKRNVLEADHRRSLQFVFNKHRFLPTLLAIFFTKLELCTITKYISNNMLLSTGLT